MKTTAKLRAGGVNQSKNGPIGLESGLLGRGTWKGKNQGGRLGDKSPTRREGGLKLAKRAPPNGLKLPGRFWQTGKE